LAIFQSKLVAESMLFVIVLNYLFLFFGYRNIEILAIRSLWAHSESDLRVSRVAFVRELASLPSRRGSGSKRRADHADFF
jgi:hypothetical protein